MYRSKEPLGNCVTAARQTLTLFVGVRIPIPQPENDRFRQESVVFSYIRLTASYIGCASYICFASDIGLRPVLEANIISLKPQVSIPLSRRENITPS